jgi:hypothetical protein
LILTPRPQSDTATTDTPAIQQVETLAPQTSGPSPVPALSISLLGPLRIDGTKQPLKRAATRELIAYLALHPHAATRDELTEAVWPAQNPERILPRFWQSVTDARRALADAWVRDGEHYHLDRTQIRIDLDQLDRLLANTGPDDDEPHALEAALELWRGEPLEGSDYTWADGDIRRLTATYLGLLERAGHAQLERGDARGALQWPSKPSRSTSSTSRPGASHCKQNTSSGCASPSPSATTTSPTRSMSNSAYSQRARHGSCTDSCSGKASVVHRRLASPS